ncbi:hypothetical protein A3H80_04235 [Candidatus Roizmanbacteria bacterium RIFCSPLOWO2_02_FULL_37_19]|nr:MAG: hypothetical protein A2862_04330 [Candidatus Roizmanbacteria bacterium RIFCSPHIGHO2_01_FULL_38_41]OGK32458.1 MAG: hypothetical protein A3E10_00145 [Candidatus Roizmanbacteria bacterium RIFCSPHIGHO2_12_FULL_37_23]OGK53655.1 MAG: hypothetical protein A3H80_04235 [Candidatus Roizmanbacteria bacterium RIFCSPLOWO2_02_FULL_37_19]OGK60200.1 MAG: hypothetical protein A3G65_01230 [Candidatus Roizmanbacteria bacterium RIFCSPLOWO2_12_FULL_37_7b]
MLYRGIDFLRGLPEEVVSDKVIRRIQNDPGVIVLRALVATLRRLEYHDGIKDDFRADNLYYQVVRNLQRREDELFALYLPRTAEKVESRFGDSEERWYTVVNLARMVSTLFANQGAPYGVLDCRAKSNFGIWEKTRRYGHDPDEIFDSLGMRIVVKSEQDAYTLRDILLSNYDLMPEHTFSHSGKIHTPNRDTLQGRTIGQYGALYVNPIIDDEITEVQILPEDVYSDIEMWAPVALRGLAFYKQHFQD